MRMSACTLRQWNATFEHELSHLYPREECRRFVSMLAEHYCKWSRTKQLTSADETLPPHANQQFGIILEGLKQARPIQHLIGEAWFMERPFSVSSDVLIPRPETEELVHHIVNDNQCPNPTILDIGTGSGCIAISLKLMIPHATVSAWDISEKALTLARENSQSHHCDVLFSRTDVLTQNPDEGEQYDIVVSNPPYICVQEKKLMHANVLKHEPHLALFVPDSDPLLFYRTIARLAQTILKPSGKLYFEINEAYGTETANMLTSMGYINIDILNDLQGKQRMLRAHRQP